MKLTLTVDMPRQMIELCLIAMGYSAVINGDVWTLTHHTYEGEHEFTTKELVSWLNTCNLTLTGNQ